MMMPASSNTKRRHVVSHTTFRGFFLFSAAVVATAYLYFVVKLFDNNQPTNDVIVTDARTETAPQLAVKTQPPAFVYNCLTNKPIRPVSLHQSNKYTVDNGLLRSKLENDESRAASFAKIYKEKTWGGGEMVNGTHFGGSGPGSLMSSTIQVRKTLDAVIERVKSELGKERITLLDLPCGDLVWMKNYLQQRHDIDYTGMDIVPSLVAAHSQAYTQKHSWKFKQHDIAKDPLDEKYDLIFSRQMTQHLGTEDTMRVLDHFSDGASYLLISNYPKVKSNKGLNTKTPHRFRQQNFNTLPYSLTDPICEDEEAGQCMNYLYKLPLRQWQQ